MRFALFVAALLALTSVVGAQEPSAPPTTQETPVAGAAGETTLPQRRTRTGPNAAGTGIIRGRVVRSDTGMPLRRVQVRAIAEKPHSVFTDDNGRYELSGLPEGRYLLDAAKGGFVQTFHGQRRSFGSGRPVTLAEGQMLERIDFALPPGGVVTGRIVDESGEPVINANVIAVRMAFTNGQRQPSQAGGSQTDDRGEFRIYGLTPGEYFIQADYRLPSELSGVRLGYVATYYPGTPIRGEAQGVAVKPGEEVSGIAFALSPTRTASIAGVVRNADGTPAMQTFVIARDTLTNALAFTGEGFAQTSPDGSFVISNLPPGSYVVEAQTMLSPREGSGRTDVVLGGRDVTGLVIAISRGVTARGRVRFDTGAPPRGMKPDRVRVFASSVDPHEMSADREPPALRDDWTFELAGLRGRRVLNAFAFEGEWTTKSVSMDGSDATDAPIEFNAADVDNIEIVLTQRMTELSGVVTDSKGEKVSDAAVIAFVDDPQRWRPNTRFVQYARPDQDGRFRIQGLPSSRYVVIAIDEIEPGEESDPELLEQLRQRGTRITLRDAEKRTLDLKVSAY